MKKNMPKVCNIFSVVLVIAFFVKSLMDYGKYSPIENSAPFSAWVLTNAIGFLVPALAVFLLGRIVKKKS
ncbi:MAG: hypothetical protein Q4A52_06755 [Bacillota bacterium]|nr:hypothetical protein [Bacillota bacterium]